MKRTSWSTIGIVAAIVGLLTVFMALLYNWQLAASVAEREQLQRRTESDTKMFADDFNREIQGAFFNFQVDPMRVANSDGTEIAERYDYWKQNTAYPGLIDGIYALPSGSPLLKFDALSKTFVPAPTDQNLAKITEKIANAGRATPVIDAGYALAVPLMPFEEKVDRILVRRSPDKAAITTDAPIELPKPMGYIIVLLNEGVIKEKMLPELAAKHFPNGNFKVGVTDPTGQTIFSTAPIGEGLDAKASLFDLTPDHLIWVANREMLPRRSPSGDESEVVLNQRIERRSISPEDGPSKVEGGETFTIQMNESGANRRTTVVTGNPLNDSEWRLGVEHTAGSIDEFIRGERNRNLAIGFGIYLLLLGSIIAIVYSSLRAKAYAQRQIDFVSSVSHEFRTPLAVIYTAGENLADGVARDGDQVTRYGDLIKGEGKKLSAMVEQILDFAGARSRKKQYTLASGDVSSAVAKALADSEPLLKEGGFDVETSLTDSLPNAQIDREAIETAVRNLIQNAVKYSNGTRWLKVSTENGGGAIKIVVEDGGIGISASDRKKIFEPFYRAKEVVDAQIHGNGLGLSLVKEIAEAHGGKISVESDQAKGSKFTIELPPA